MNRCYGSILVATLAAFIAWLTLTNEVVEEIVTKLSDVEYYGSNHPDVPLRDVYDFIVVGAGSAGCVVANRLSENPNWNVLLIEAGQEENSVMDVPAFVHYLQHSPKINWGYKTEPSNESCLAMNNTQCSWPRGRVMGGSSVLNYMIYTRGNRRDFDEWATMGADGWSFEDVLPYFKKLENSRIPSDTIEDMAGRSGPMSVTYPNYRSTISKYFEGAIQELGLPEANYNEKEQIGFSYIQATLKNGLRHSSNRAYIDPIRRERQNLHVKTKSFATKILIDPQTKVANGVEFIQKGQKYTAKVQKEVIVSAGTINSPQLLMLSGIGPDEHLRDKKIEPIVDLPVGLNLMDHYSSLAVFTVNHSTASNEIENMKNWYSYFSKHGSGVLELLGGCESLVFINTQNFTQHDVYPDIELILISGTPFDFKGTTQNLNLNSKLFEIIGEWRNRKQKGLSVIQTLVRPKSRGRLQLRNNDPHTHPEIHSGYYTDPDDVRTSVRGMKKILLLEQTEHFKRINATLYRPPLKQCDRFAYDTDAYWECYIRHITFTIFHYSGTCKMGQVDDPTTVVNSRLQVHGVKGLRVADASVMPLIVSGHPNAAILMIGEKAADLIKEDWRKKMIR